MLKSAAKLRVSKHGPPSSFERPSSVSIISSTASPALASGGAAGAIRSRGIIAFTMQIAIICGAWVASRWGSLAPLAIMAGIKTVFDFGHRAAR